jgi:beta-lactam-binding protein with PASTA domain/Ca2+-binding RTX toxin-like protein
MKHRVVTCRRAPLAKPSAVVALVAMLVSQSLPAGWATTTLRAQAPVGAGFNLNAADLRFILQQIKIAENHAAGGSLLGPGPNQIGDPRHPFGLRTVDGRWNNLMEGQEKFGAADLVFPRLVPAQFKAAEVIDPDGPTGPAPPGPTTYAQKSGIVGDSRPRLISNLIVDQTRANPAAVAAAGPGAEPDASGSLFIPNTAPDVGLSAPYNSMFTLFGQFFDHGLDLVTKGGGTVFVPLRADDPLIVGHDGVAGTADDPANPPPPSQRFMVLSRALNQPGPDNVLGTDDDVQEATNTTTPFVDQNQTYTSHPSHQVFLRQYVAGATGPVATGRLLDGAIHGNIANWSEVKAQAATLLGIALSDMDVHNVPLLATDPYGRFLRGASGLPQLVMADGTLREGNLAAPVSTTGALGTGHAFLDDIAHNAVPKAGLAPDGDTTISTATQRQPAGTYDNELLDRHFITGDGRGNENIGLTAIHTLFHSEHNRLVTDINFLIGDLLTAEEVADWQRVNPASGWDYGERLFQAARFVTEMQYQHLVFEEFARKVQPQVNVFTGYHTEINSAIAAEFAHAVYRFGHSMLTETVARTNPDGTTNDISLLDAFLNPLAFNGPNGTMTAAEAAGSIVQGMSTQVGNELDEFVTEALRNRLLGLPLDLATINITRGRSEGIPTLNAARRQFYEQTGNSALLPYENWFDFGAAIRHPESLANFVAAYGIHPTIQAATTIAARRQAAEALLADSSFMFSTGTGVDDVDYWVGGLAEKQSPFGGLLGSTFNYVFETQMERLQDGDRFYYLTRTVGLNMLTQLEGNSLAELAMRNSTASGLPADVFARPDLIFNLANLGTSGRILDDPNTTEYDESTLLTRMPNGTIRYTGDKHVIWNGRDTTATDRVWSSEGDDTLRGNGGRDIMLGGAGNDQFIGGTGDDILTDEFGDDVLKGGDGNDALSSGPGFDLNQGGRGKDFIVGGSDPTETFGGPDDDFIFAGDSEDIVFGDDGNDWLEGGTHADLLQGDHGFPFQDDPNGGHDVIIGGGGNDDADAEGGDDIIVAGPGIERNEGMLGFDWVTHKGDPQRVDADMRLTGLLPPNVEDLRDRFDVVEGLSGWQFNDVLRGDDLEGDALNTLTTSGVNLIAGLGTILGTRTSFTGGNIILGGAGSDLIEGNGGNDLIDGDAWLNVQLEAPDLVNGGTKRVDNMSQLRTDVFAGNINPGAIQIRRSIVVTLASPADIDTAAFSGPEADYDVTVNADGTITVAHLRGTAIDGTDTLRNIERLQFADVTREVTSTVVTTVPDIVGETQALATSMIVGADLSVGVVTFANDSVVPAGRVISQSRAAGTVVDQLRMVDFVVSLGPANVLVPSVVDALEQDATEALIAAGLRAGSITRTSSTTVGFGRVISQNPTAGGSVAPGTAVALVISTGAPNVQVPAVINLTEADARTQLTGAGLTVGEVTTANSDSVPAGSVISQNPAPEASVAPGTAVSFVVSSGPEFVPVPNVVGATEAEAIEAIAAASLSVGTITSETSATVAQGLVIRQTPDANTTTRPGTAVSFVVSLGPPDPTRISVPNVVGLTDAAAQTAITDATLTVGTITEQNSDTVAAGSIISQDPAAGTLVETGAVVTLVRSLGRANVNVPNVVDQPEDAARTMITGAGLTVGTVTEANSSVIAAGRIISQNPAAGTSVPTGTAVALVRSLGAAPVNVPNVVNQTEDAARTAITNAGLVVGTVSTATSNTFALGRIISQDPAAGTSVATGTTVSLVRSLGPATVPVPNVVGQTEAAARTSITNAGLTVGTITDQASASVPVGSIISTTPAAGVQAPVGSAVALVRSTGPATVNVPNVVGQTEAAARTAITDVGLTVGTITQESSATVPLGSIIRQTPAANTTVNVGTAVALVRSTGPSSSGPVSVAPQESFNLSVIGTTVPVRIEWSATVAAGAPALARYELQRSTNNGATWTNLTLRTALQTSEVYTLTPGTTYQYRVRAVDTAGTVGAYATGTPFTPSITQESAASVTYTGTWTTETVTTASGGTQRFATAAGATATFNFTGRNVAWATVRANNRGRAEVIVDGVSAGTIDLFQTSTTASNRRLMFERSFATDGPHTIQIRVLGTKATSSTSTRVDVDAFVVTRGTAPTTGVTVPNVIGQTEASATAELTAANLEVGLITTDNSNTVPEGSIISQDPAAGTQVAAGSQVALVRSLGPASTTATVPNVVGQTEAAARTAITNAGFIVGAITTASHATVPSGSIISQNPAGGTSATTGSAIALVRSTGPEPTTATVPNVVGQTEAAARTAITNAGFTVGAITTASHATIPSGSIISQTPTAGTTATTGSAIALVRSTGPAADTAAPVSVAPAVSPNLSVMGSTVPFRVSWSATDNVGVARYELQRSTNNGSTWSNVTLSTALQTAETYLLTPGTTYIYRVRAIDAAGNVGAYATGTAFTPRVTQENAAAVTYAGTWTTETITSASGGAQRFASAAGATATYTFTGRAIAWAAVRANNRGRAEVFIDGVSQGVVDLYHSSTTPSMRRLMFEHTFATSGTHTIQIRVLGTKTGASAGTRVDVDAFVIAQ